MRRLSAWARVKLTRVHVDPTRLFIRSAVLRCPALVSFFKKPQVLEVLGLDAFPA